MDSSQYSQNLDELVLIWSDLSENLEAREAGNDDTLFLERSDAFENIPDRLLDKFTFPI